MPAKSEAEQIRFLLAIIEHSQGCDYEEVANSTGLYKSGKFVKQALQSLKTKYCSSAVGGTLPVTLNGKHSRVTPNSRGSAKKRSGDIDGKDENPSKKRKTVAEVAQYKSDDELAPDKEA